MADKFNPTDVLNHITKMNKQADKIWHEWYHGHIPAMEMLDKLSAHYKLGSDWVEIYKEILWLTK